MLFCHSEVMILVPDGLIFHTVSGSCGTKKKVTDFFLFCETFTFVMEET